MPSKNNQSPQSGFSWDWSKSNQAIQVGWSNQSIEVVILLWYEWARGDQQGIQRNHDCAYQGYYGVKDSDDSDNIRVQRRHPINIAREVWIENTLASQTSQKPNWDHQAGWSST